MIHGEGDYRYDEIRNWAKLPEGWVFSQVSDASRRLEGQDLRLYPRQAPDRSLRQVRELVKTGML